MSFGIGLISVGTVAIVLGYLPARWGRHVRGAGQGKLGIAWGVLLIVAGVVLTVTD